MKDMILHPVKFILLALLISYAMLVKANPGYRPADVTKKATTYRVAVGGLSTRATAGVKDSRQNATLAAKRAEMRMIVALSANIYEEMGLEDSGLSRKAFQYAFTGFYKLRKKGLLHRTNILTICDFSQSSSNQRLYVIDVRTRRILYRTYVAHGINSGEEFANSFSNQMESCKSSLGFYVTSQTYTGANGLSLRINGLEKGVNDNARKRAIVIHGASYVSTRIMHKYGVMGTTFGCPAIPTEMTSQIIPVVKNGSCFFIYYPSKKYLNHSQVING